MPNFFRNRPIFAQNVPNVTRVNSAIFTYRTFAVSISKWHTDDTDRTDDHSYFMG